MQQRVVGSLVLNDEVRRKRIVRGWGSTDEEAMTPEQALGEQKVPSLAAVHQGQHVAVASLEELGRHGDRVPNVIRHIDETLKRCQ